MDSKNIANEISGVNWNAVALFWTQFLFLKHWIFSLLFFVFFLNFWNQIGLKLPYFEANKSFFKIFKILKEINKNKAYYLLGACWDKNYLLLALMALFFTYVSSFCKMSENCLQQIPGLMNLKFWTQSLVRVVCDPFWAELFFFKELFFFLFCFFKVFYYCRNFQKNFSSWFQEQNVQVFGIPHLGPMGVLSAIASFPYF